MLPLSLCVSQTASKLNEIGEQIDETTKQEFDEKFRVELKRYSLFLMTYKEFYQVCTISLNRIHSKIRNGWHQVYLLYRGEWG